MRYDSAVEWEIPAADRRIADKVFDDLGYDPDWGVGRGGSFFVRVPIDQVDIEDLKSELLKRRVRLFKVKEEVSMMERYKPLFPVNEDLLPGGKGDDYTDADFDPKEVAMGMEVEAEHTPDPAIADEIVHDHLSERPDYYEVLKDAGLADELGEKVDELSEKRAQKSLQQLAEFRRRY